MGTISAYLKNQQEAGKFRCRRRPPASAWLMALLAITTPALATPAARAQTPLAQDIGGQKLRLMQPLDGATVRETVPIRMSRGILPTSGYVAVLVDGVFRTAREVPTRGDLLYDWDTKGSFTTPDNPDQPQYTQDGPHDIQVEVFDHDGTLVGVAESHVRVANKITALPDGVKLVYHWRLDEAQRYQYTATLSNDQTDNGGAKQTVQDADVKFDRSVEDATGGQYLLRDLILPNGFLTTGSSPVLIQAAYDLKSRYRTVNSYGEVIVNNVPFSPGDHFGFPIAQFPGRRVNVGDSWESHMEVALGWDALRPTMITGTAKLDSFEWQNGYPTAKIIETYDGPATFHLNQQDDAAQAAQTAANTQQNTLGPVNASDIHITRTIWFAYNSGQLIRVETDMTVNANMSTEQVAALGATGTGGAGPGGMAFAGMGRGREDGGPAGMPPPGYMPPYMGGGGPPTGFNPGMMMGAKGPGMMMPGGPGGFGAGRFGPGGFRPPIAGNAATQAQPTSPTKLALHSVMSLISVHS